MSVARAAGIPMQCSMTDLSGDFGLRFPDEFLERSGNMIEAVNHLRPVIWAKGTLLTPQHLQAQDRFLEDSLNFRFDALRFRPWGFASLEIQPELLEAGTLSVQSATGIFPDGLLFSIPDSDLPPPAKTLTTSFRPDDKYVDVYMAVPSYLPSGVNVSNGTNSADTRFSAEVMLLRDEVSGLAERPVQVARKNLRLVTSGTSLEGAAAMRVARVVRSGGGRYALDPAIVPPLVDFSASTVLRGILTRVVETMVARASSLSGRRRHRSQGLADFTSTDIANFWLLYSVNTYFPVLRHLLGSRRRHPEDVFGVMTALAGALTTFSQSVDPSHLPDYDHQELGACFTALGDQLLTLLETVAPSNCVSIPFQRISEGILGASLDEDRLLQNTRLFLAFASSAPEAETIARVPKLVKVCSATHIETLVRQALPGVALLHEPAPPAFLPVKMGFQYFAVNQSGGAWESILRARNIAAYVPGEFGDPKLELLVVLPQAEQR